MNLFEEIFSPTVSAIQATAAKENLRAARRLCDEAGHPSYRVHGRMSPNKVVCPRCHCSWAIGPKTEPTT